MNTNWRTTLKKSIEARYIQKPEKEWFAVIISTNGNLNLTLVSDRFSGMSIQERRDQITKLLHENKIFIRVGFLSLLTIEQAKSVGVSPLPPREEEFYDWLDLVIWAANAYFEGAAPKRKPRQPHTLAFYSFKGGVGCTTALIHVAWTLAMQGRKVVVVDLDLETPGLGAAINLSPQHGIVDYFYHRAYLPEDIEPEISVSKIVSEVKTSDEGRLFVVPAGTLSFDYISQVDDLYANSTTETGHDLWTTFANEINESLQPDLIIVDAGTGLNQWGAFSLLRASDEAIVLLSPNEQNYQGVSLLLEALVTINVPVHLVFSLVSSLDNEKVLKHWQFLRNYGNVKNAKDQLPLQVPYLPAMALAEHYPVPTLLDYYLPIVNEIKKSGKY